VIQKKLILLSYLSYLLRLRLLSEDSYLLEGLQSADKTKTHPKAKLQNAPTFTGNGSHSHACLLLVIKIKTCIYQVCKRQSADTNVLIGQYRLSVHLKKIVNSWTDQLINNLQFLKSYMTHRHTD